MESVPVLTPYNPCADVAPIDMTQTRARLGPFPLGIVRLAIALLLAAGVAARAAAQPPATAGELRWGGDPEGGSPYVEADPLDPSRVVGFEVDVAALIASKLGLTPRFQPVQFASIDASVKRGDFLIGLGGIEDTPARRATLAVTVPYYEFREVLTVRAGDASRFRTLADLRGRRVATLGGTIAYEILLASQAGGGAVAVSYDDDVHPYSDLAIGRVDAVLLDHVLAEKAMRRERGLVTQPDAVAVGHYVGVLDLRNAAVRDRIDAILREAMRDGTLESIFRRWGLWNDDQRALYARVLGATARRRLAQPRNRRRARLTGRRRDRPTRPPPCGVTCRRSSGRRSSPSCCRASRWRSPSCSASPSRAGASTAGGCCGPCSPPTWN